MAIHWNGGHATRHAVRRPVQSQRQLRDGSRLRARAAELHRRNEAAAAIAAALDAEGVTPPRRASYGPDQVRWRFRYYGSTPTRPPEKLGQSEWWLPALAAKLAVPVKKLRAWASRKWCHARQTGAGRRRVIWADAEEVRRLRRLARQSELGGSSYPTGLTTPRKKG